MSMAEVKYIKGYAPSVLEPPEAKDGLQGRLLVPTN